eukprot:CAMPEP_0117678570 /NCGR_PEP_ID=MMETSP0804-20121206/17368_1 /TAXON_ID=1074897 /ORGANISM="Tetraselmis astigmatica, Strain CCMP880" /LENGTH=180 /DNA_ID=CAMNT_0005487967 /DNA_START=428 /DNA_END=967 /DNA_ORIENTATION=-
MAPFMPEAQARAELRTDIAARFPTCYQAFLSVDVHRTGKIEVGEIERILEIYNLPPTHAAGIFKKMDRNGNGVIDYGEFSAEFFGAPSPVALPLQPSPMNIAASTPPPYAQKPGEELADKLQQHYSTARKAFLKLDQDRSGYVSEDELQALEKAYNLPLDNVLTAVDRNSDGKLSYNEVA